MKRDKQELQGTGTVKCGACKRSLESVMLEMYRRLNWETRICWNDKPTEYTHPLCFSCVDRINEPNCMCGRPKAPDALECKHCYSKRSQNICMCDDCLDKCSDQGSIINDGKHSFNYEDMTVLRGGAHTYAIGSHILVQCCEYCLKVKQTRIDVKKSKDSSLILELIKNKVDGWKSLITTPQWKKSNPEGFTDCDSDDPDTTWDYEKMSQQRKDIWDEADPQIRSRHVSHYEEEDKYK